MIRIEIVSPLSPKRGPSAKGRGHSCRLDSRLRGMNGYGHINPAESDLVHWHRDDVPVNHSHSRLFGAQLWSMIRCLFLCSAV